jgi:hypothetical protein
MKPLAIALMALVVAAAPTPLAQETRSVAITVRETAGIRRTQFPVAAEVTLPRGAAADPARMRLTTADSPEAVPGQFTPDTRWPDGSIARLTVYFNVSIGPTESRSYRLEFGDRVEPVPAPPGLAVVEGVDAIQVGNIRFGRTGSPLVLSASYRSGEFIGQGSNTLIVVDSAGARHGLSEAPDLAVEVVRSGPLSVALRYTGMIPLDAGYSTPVVVTFDLPNSKAWFKASTVVADPARRVREVVFDTPLAFGAHPWTWDVATMNGSYGAFRNPTDAAALVYTVPRSGPPTWHIETGTEDQLAPYETSTAGQAAPISGWWHVQDAARAVAFIVEDFGATPGTYTVRLNGLGQTSIGFAPAGAPGEHRLTLFEHFVSTPVALGAATSPKSALSPLAVTVQ